VSHRNFLVHDIMNAAVTITCEWVNVACSSMSISSTNRLVECQECHSLYHQVVETHCLLVNTVRYDTRCYLNMRSEADTSQLTIPQGTNN